MFRGITRLSQMFKCYKLSSILRVRPDLHLPQQARPTEELVNIWEFHWGFARVLRDAITMHFGGTLNTLNSTY